jgi:predicted transcriptional regulator
MIIARYILMCLEKALRRRQRLMMKIFVRWVIVIAAVLVTNQAAQAIEMGEIPPKVELREKLGGRLDGTPWSSEELKGRAHAVFYVDPDERDTNNDASEALDREKFPAEKFYSLGIINMAATWLPNMVLSSLLKEKQKRYPKTLYVRDYKKVLVNAWKITDHSSNVLAFDKEGRLIFRKDGKLTAEEIQTLLKVIRDHL